MNGFDGTITAGRKGIAYDWRGLLAEHGSTQTNGTTGAPAHLDREFDRLVAGIGTELDGSVAAHAVSR